MITIYVSNRNYVNGVLKSKNKYCEERYFVDVKFMCVYVCVHVRVSMCQRSTLVSSAVQTLKNIFGTYVCQGTTVFFTI